MSTGNFFQIERTGSVFGEVDAVGNTLVQTDSISDTLFRYEAGGNNAEINFETGGIAEIDTENEWEFSEAVIEAIYHDPELEETILSAMRRVDRYLNQIGYNKKRIQAKIEESERPPIVREYYLRVVIAVSDVSEWLEIEDEIQNIVLESEVGDTELYAVVDRFRE